MTRLGSEALATYVGLLLRLHDLIVAGQGEDSEADELRELMDDPWARLDMDQVALMRGLSADLYGVGAARIRGPAPPASAQSELMASLGARDWLRALEMLRLHPGICAPAESAALRGEIWRDLGCADVAARFFEDSARLAGVRAPWVRAPAAAPQQHGNPAPRRQFPRYQQIEGM